MEERTTWQLLRTCRDYRAFPMNFLLPRVDLDGQKPPTEIAGDVGSGPFQHQLLELTDKLIFNINHSIMVSDDY